MMQIVVYFGIMEYGQRINFCDTGATISRLKYEVYKNCDLDRVILKWNSVT